MKKVLLKSKNIMISYNNHKRIWSSFILLSAIFLSSCSSQTGSASLNSKINADENSKESTTSDFNAESRARFDEIKESFPELESIECYDDDCSNVVYFNLNTVPDDLELAIRGNTATFSNFKMKETGTSHVSIFARHNGKTILQCDGAKGVVTECK